VPLILKKATPLHRPIWQVDAMVVLSKDDV
jgi:hypothetical protein